MHTLLYGEALLTKLFTGNIAAPRGIGIFRGSYYPVYIEDRSSVSFGFSSTSSINIEEEKSMSEGTGVCMTKKSGEPFRILIVDDSVFVQKQMSMILASKGFEVIETANDGLEALEKYQSKKDQIDLITMDITMPRMDGITALSKLIEFDPKVAVIMVSALGKEDLVKKSLLLGAKNYVVKPLNRDKVIDRIVDILAHLC